jgi:hypothetical protein
MSGPEITTPITDSFQEQERRNAEERSGLRAELAQTKEALRLERLFGEALCERLCFCGICPSAVRLEGKPNGQCRTGKPARDCWGMAMRKGGETE